MRQKTYGRNLKIFKLREKGETFAAIGRKFNISTARAQQIHHGMLRRGAKDLIEEATDITGLNTDTRKAMDKATGIENCSLVDFQNFVMHNPDWREGIPEKCLIELQNFCLMNGITIEKDLYYLGLDRRACNMICRRMEIDRRPMLNDLKEVLKDPEWRTNLRRIRNMGIKSVRKLEKFALEQGVLVEPENVLAMGLSPEAVAAIAPVSGYKVRCISQITLEDVRKIVRPLGKHDQRVDVNKHTPWEIVEEIKAFAREHNLIPER